MDRRITKPFTLRISQAEVIQSQLGADDLKALAPDTAQNGGVLCPTVYCGGGYSGPERLLEDLATRPGVR